MPSPRSENTSGENTSGPRAARRFEAGSVAIEPTVEAVLRRGLSAAPGDRFASMDELIAELEPALGERLIELERAVSLERAIADTSKMVGPLSILIAVMVAAGVILGTVMAWRGIADGVALSWRHALWIDGSGIVAIALGAALFRKLLFATPRSARVTGSFALLLGGIIAADQLAYALGEDSPQATAHSMMMGCAMAALLATTLLRDVWPAAAIHAAAVVCVLRDPGYAPMWAGIAMSSTGLLFVRAFRRAARERGKP